MKQDESFGIIPLRQEKGEWEVFLIQHREGGYWGFPKGHRESEETPFEAATRELYEETGLSPSRLLQEEPLYEQYWFQHEGQKIFKKVTYFVAEVSGKVELQKAEINDGIWLPLQVGIEKVTHPEGKAILAEVIKALT